MTLLSTRRIGLVQGPQGIQGALGPPSPSIVQAAQTPNYGLFQNPIVVTHAAPGTLTSVNQLAIIETGTGTTSLTLGAPVAGLVLACFDTDCSAATSACTVTSATMFEDPNTGTLGTTAILNVNGFGLAWYYDPNRGHYSLLWAYYPIAVIGTSSNIAPGSTVPLNPARSQVLVIDTTGAQSHITMPGAPKDMDIVRVAFIGATNPNLQAFTANTGQIIEAPDNAGTFSGVAGTVTVQPAGSKWGWFWQNANNRWVMFL